MTRSARGTTCTSIGVTPTGSASTCTAVGRLALTRICRPRRLISFESCAVCPKAMLMKCRAVYAKLVPAPPVPVPGSRSARGEADVPDFEAVPPALRTVLIADEDPSFRRYLALPLAAQGFVIHEAADGASAWQLAQQSRPWMILADISLPEVDGFEFCRRVRNHPRGVTIEASGDFAPAVGSRTPIRKS